MPQRAAACELRRMAPRVAVEARIGEPVPIGLPLPPAHAKAGIHLVIDAELFRLVLVEVVREAVDVDAELGMGAQRIQAERCAEQSGAHRSPPQPRARAAKSAYPRNPSNPLV